MDERRQRTWRRLWAAGVIAAAVATIGVVPTLASPEAGGRALLPDLDQALPSQLGIHETTGAQGKQFELAFDSAVDNVGDGPLLVHGSRQAVDEPIMRATQRVRTDTGATIEYADVGEMGYVTSPDHSHWHLGGFDRYQLHRVGDAQGAARPDRKTGFCLGDRYETDRATELPNEPQGAQLTGYCRPGEPNALSVDQGMSVGYGDNYLARLEGQSIDVTGLAAGQYLLVHRVNADGRLRERTTANNAASVLVALSWPQGTGAKPGLEVLARCPDSETCAAPAAGGSAAAPAAPPVAPASTTAFRPRLPNMTASVAGYFVRQSLVRRFGRGLRGLRRSCRRTDAVAFACRVRFLRSPYRYRGRVWVRHSLAGGRVAYRRRIDVTGTRTPCRARSACRRHVRVGP